MSKRPPQPEVEWTVDQAPRDAEVSPPSVAPAAPRRRFRPSRRHFAWAAGLLALLLLAALGLWAFTRDGWARLRAQVEAEIAYEDEQSLARQPDLVRGLQSPENPAWLDLRAAEAALGLPAPRPAPHLAPAAESAQILDFDAAGQDRFDVTVVRAYAGPAGQTYRFTLRQHYRSLGPGLWERLPPDEAALIATTGWQGARLSAILPAADQALLTVVLPLVDGYAEQACADWGCPAELSVPLVLTGWLEELPLPGPTITAPHPIAFDLALQPDPEPRRLVVGAPSLTGYPLDEAARTAYTNGLSAAVLDYIAGELTGTGRLPADYYLDALIARAERRLGLWPAQPLASDPSAFTPPADLWAITEPPEGATPEGETARRAQALAYLDLALRDQPVSVDGALLDTLRRQGALFEWLSPVRDWETVGADWLSYAQGLTPPPPSIPEASLEGLALQCNSGTSIRLAGSDHLLASAGPLPGLPANALSRDGRYLALLAWAADGDRQLLVHDLVNDSLSYVAETNPLLPLGWDSSDRLVYFALEPIVALALMGYRPGDDAPVQLLAEALWPDWPGLDTVWSADGSALALTLSIDDAPRPAVWRADDPGRVQVVTALAGLYSTLSPDGRWLAYVPWSTGPADQPFASSIRLVDLALGVEWELLNRGAVNGNGNAAAFFSLLHWAPDSRTLAFLAASMSGSATLHTLDLASGQLTTIAGGPGHSIIPAGFSADGRFLAYLDNVGNSDTVSVIVFDLQTGSANRVRNLSFDHLRRAQTGLLPAYPTGVAAWAPLGRLLALSTPAGVYVTDVATGDARWLTFEPCGRVVWYAIE